MSTRQEIVEKPAPEQGLYPGVSFDEYFAWDAVNQSLLNRFRRTPAHVLYELQNESKTTPALELGRLTHLATLEPDRYASEVVAAPKIDKRSKSGKAEWRRFQEDNEGKVIAEAQDHTKALAMAKAVREHPTASLLLNGVGVNEVSVVWDDSAHGARCKARIDRYAHLNEFPTIGELKTSRNAARREFERSILNFGYDVQAAHLVAGLEAIHPLEAGDPFRRFVFIVVESEPPHLCALYELDDESLEEGYRKRSQYLSKWRECVQSSKWPGYPDGVQDARLPAWAFKQWIDV